MFSNVYTKRDGTMAVHTSTTKRGLVMVLVLAMMMSLMNYQFMTTAEAANSLPSTGIGNTVDGNPAQIDYNDIDWVNPDSANGLVRMKETIDYARDAEGNRIENQFVLKVDVQTKEKIEDMSIDPNSAVVLALDLSQSMNGRVQTLKTAATNFINNYATGQGKRYLAIVVYGQAGVTILQWTDVNTTAGKAAAIAALTSSNVKTQFRYNNSPGQLVTSSGTQDGGYTNISAALKLTDNLFKNLPAGVDFTDFDSTTGGQNKFSIVFTDGLPTARINSGIGTGATSTITSTALITASETARYVSNPAVEFITESNAYGEVLNTAGIHTLAIKYAYDSVGGANAGKLSRGMSYASDIKSATDGASLNLVFQEYASMTAVSAQPWLVTLPLADPIFNSSNPATASLEWQLTEAERTSIDEDGFKYSYTKTFPITLDTLSEAFDEGSIYEASLADTSKLDFNLIYTSGSTGSSPTVHNVQGSGIFNVPEVHGFEADLQFFKKDADTGALLNGFRFVATSDATTISSGEIRTYDAISANQATNGGVAVDGVVFFKDNNNGLFNKLTSDLSIFDGQNTLPSGQNYTLNETLTAEQQLLWTPSTSENIPIEVHWGQVTNSFPTDFTNARKVGSFTVEKKLAGEAAQWGATGTSPYAIAVKVIATASGVDDKANSGLNYTVGQYIQFAKDATTGEYKATKNSTATPTATNGALVTVTSDASVKFVELLSGLTVQVEEFGTDGTYVPTIDYTGAGADDTAKTLTIIADVNADQVASLVTVTNTYVTSKGKLTIKKILGDNSEDWGVGDDTIFTGVVMVSGGNNSGKYLSLSGSNGTYVYEGLVDVTEASEIQFSVNSPASITAIPMYTQLVVQETGLNGNIYTFTPSYANPDGDNEYAYILSSAVDEDGKTITVTNNFNVPYGSLDIIKSFHSDGNHAAWGATDYTTFTAILTSNGGNVELRATTGGYEYVGTTTGAATPVTFSVASKASITQIPSGTAIGVTETSGTGYHATYPSGSAVTISFDITSTVTIVNQYDHAGVIKAKKTGDGRTSTTFYLFDASNGLIRTTPITGGTSTDYINLHDGSLNYGSYSLYEVTAKKYAPSTSDSALWAPVTTTVGAPTALASAINDPALSVFRYLGDLTINGSSLVNSVKSIELENVDIDNATLTISKIITGAAEQWPVTNTDTFHATVKVSGGAFLELEQNATNPAVYKFVGFTDSALAATVAFSAATSVSITDIPNGLELVVTETLGEHGAVYDVTYAYANGQYTSGDSVFVYTDSNAGVEITNDFEVPTGNLSVIKALGANYSPWGVTADTTFSAILTTENGTKGVALTPGTSANGYDWTWDGETTTAAATQIEISSGHAVTVGQIPSGTAITIVEDDSNPLYEASYSSSSNVIVYNETIDVTVTNDYLPAGSVYVNKLGEGRNDTIFFLVKNGNIVNGTGTPIVTGLVNPVLLAEYLAYGNYDLYEATTVDFAPVTSGWESVATTNVPVAIAAIIDGTSKTNVFKLTSGIEVANTQTQLSPQITVTNEYISNARLVIEKVLGENADLWSVDSTTTFSAVVQITNGAFAGEYLTFDQVSGSNTYAYSGSTTDSALASKVTFAEDDSATITGLPNGLSLVVIEDVDAGIWNASYVYSDGDTDYATVNTNTTDTAIVTNDYEIPTGDLNIIKNLGENAGAYGSDVTTTFSAFLTADGENVTLAQGSAYDNYDWTWVGTTATGIATPIIIYSNETVTVGNIPSGTAITVHEVDTDQPYTADVTTSATGITVIYDGAVDATVTNNYAPNGVITVQKVGVDEDGTGAIGSLFYLVASNGTLVTQVAITANNVGDVITLGESLDYGTYDLYEVTQVKYAPTGDDDWSSVTTGPSVLGNAWTDSAVNVYKLDGGVTISNDSPSAAVAAVYVTNEDIENAAIYIEKAFAGPYGAWGVTSGSIFNAKVQISGGAFDGQFLTFTEDTPTELDSDSGATYYTYQGSTTSAVAADKVAFSQDVRAEIHDLPQNLELVIIEDGGEHYTAGYLDSVGNPIDSILSGESVIIVKNTYDTTTTSAIIRASKSAIGKDLTAGQFEFGLFTTTDTTTPTYTVRNDAAGNIVFPEIVYTTTGTITYTIKELSIGGDGWSTDSTPYRAVVTVSDLGDGELDATIAYPDGTPSFVNNYSTTSTSAIITALKSTIGKDLTAGQFQFGLFTADDAVIPFRTATNDADGNIVFPEITYTTTGSETYTIREISLGGNGWSTDSASYTATVTVSDNGLGALVATVDYSDDTREFVNSYSTTSTSAIITASKSAIGKDLANGQFQFGLFTADDAVIPFRTATNDAAGNIVFPEITYTTTGTTTYTIRELSTDGSGWSTDSSTFTATVLVVDNGLGQLISTVAYLGGAPEFVNNYSVSSTSAIINAYKIAEGKELSDGQFQFGLFTDNDAVIPLRIATNDADGNIAFPEITYTMAGTHTYTIKELSEGGHGWTTDSATFTATVTVVDNGEGALVATVTYPQEAPEFINTYVEPTGSLHILKEVIGDTDAWGIYDQTTYDVILSVGDPADGQYAQVDFENQWTAVGDIEDATTLTISVETGATVTNIPSGTAITVVEEAGAHYTATYSSDNVIVLSEETTDITVTNTYEDIEIGVEVDKDTIRRTSAAYQSLADKEEYNNVGTENYRYEVDFRNTSNTDLDEFIYEDNLEAVRAGQIDVYALYTPQVWGDIDGLFNVWYKTSNTEDDVIYAADDVENNTDGAYPNTGYKLWVAGLDATTKTLLTVDTLGLEDGEYLTGLRFEYGAVLEGFTSKNSSDVSINGEYRGDDGNLDLDNLESDNASLITPITGSEEVAPVEPFATDGENAVGKVVRRAGKVALLAEGSGVEVDWTPTSDRVDGQGNSLADAELLPATYFVRAQKEMQGEDIVAAATARGALHVLRNDVFEVLVDQDQDAVVTRTIETFAAVPELTPPETNEEPTTTPGELDPLGDITPIQRGIEPPREVTPPIVRLEEPPVPTTTSAPSPKTGDDMQKMVWILTGAMAFACMTILIIIAIKMRKRQDDDAAIDLDTGKEVR
ncbi:MAG: DUF5979 domain-containing protein [Clostridiales Family XIII bacterium]|nr:DUF5979 domain-containing protein [Clostridiales Family XIII bacterium]